jgi:hypothetical protein
MSKRAATKTARRKAKKKVTKTSALKFAGDVPMDGTRTSNCSDLLKHSFKIRKNDKTLSFLLKKIEIFF